MYYRRYVHPSFLASFSCSSCPLPTHCPLFFGPLFCSRLSHTPATTFGPSTFSPPPTLPSLTLPFLPEMPSLLCQFFRVSIDTHSAITYYILPPLFSIWPVILVFWLSASFSMLTLSHSDASRLMCAGSNTDPDAQILAPIRGCTDDTPTVTIPLSCDRAMVFVSISFLSLPALVLPILVNAAHLCLFLSYISTPMVFFRGRAFR